MKENKLSDLLFTAPQKSKIKDYAKVSSIFKDYINERYFAMAKEIYWYKEFEFFIDFSRFLEMNIKNELIKKFYYRNMVEMYEDRRAEIITNNEIKRQRRKWFN